MFAPTDELVARRVPESRIDMHGWRFEAYFCTVIFTESIFEFTIGYTHAIQLFEEIDMKIGSSEFPVCYTF